VGHDRTTAVAMVFTHTGPALLTDLLLLPALLLGHTE